MSGAGSLPSEWEDLLERAAVNIAEIYDSATIESLVKLRREDPGSYVVLYNRLKKLPAFIAKVFNREIDAEWSKTSALYHGEDSTDVVQCLTRLAQKATYFIDANNENDVFAEIPIEDDPPGLERRVVAAINSQRFKRWLIYNFKREFERAPGREALKIAIDGIDADAAHHSDRAPVHIRVGYANNTIYVDRGTPEGDVIEIDAGGWRVIPRAPVKFIRPSSGLGVLPLPEKNGNIDDLQALLNLKDRRDFILLIGWIIGCYRPIAAGAGAGEYGLLLLIGPHGSSKTSALKAALALVDPVHTEPPGQCREDRDVLVVAQETFVLGMDNVKHISNERASVYCRLLSGGKISGRSLYTDREVTSITARRPIAMTATTVVTTEVDIADRTLMIRMGESFEDKSGGRKTSAEVDAAFGKVQPKLLGCILDAVSAGLRNRDRPMPRDNLPRLADMADWLQRCEGGLGWPPGTMLTAFQDAVKEVAEDTADYDPVASAVVALMAEETRDAWGPSLVSELWALLKRRNQARGLHFQEFPRSPPALSRRLRELQVVLRRNKLVVWLVREAAGMKITITWITDAARPNGSNAAECNVDDGEGVDSLRPNYYGRARESLSRDRRP
jgi:hypothetical protein